MPSNDDRYSVPDAEKAAIAQQQVDQFRRELFGHELNLARAQALPEDATDRDQVIAASEAAIETIKGAIDVTLDIAPAE